MKVVLIYKKSKLTSYEKRKLGNLKGFVDEYIDLEDTDMILKSANYFKDGASKEIPVLLFEHNENILPINEEGATCFLQSIPTIAEIRKALEFAIDGILRLEEADLTKRVDAEVRQEYRAIFSDDGDIYEGMENEFTELI